MLDESQLQIVPFEINIAPWCRMMPARPTSRCTIDPPRARENNNVDACGPLKHCFITNLSRLRVAELRQRCIEVYPVVIRWLRLLAYVAVERDMQRSASAPLQATPV